MDHAMTDQAIEGKEVEVERNMRHDGEDRGLNEHRRASSEEEGRNGAGGGRREMNDGSVTIDAGKRWPVGRRERENEERR